MENQDSGLMALLNKKYGFTVQKHRKGYYRFTWWRNNRRIMDLPFDVPYTKAADREQVARTLGLARPQLEAAEKNIAQFSARCLLFVLIIAQSHRSLDQSSRDFQLAWLGDADQFLQEFELVDHPEDCLLLDDATKKKCGELAAHPVWSGFGRRAAVIANRGRV
jgi:hypothetical protein